MAGKPKYPVHSPQDGTPTSIPIAEIMVGKRLRSLSQKTVAELAQSMSEIGLKTSITVRWNDNQGGWILVVGFHRLEAARLLGWSEISAIIQVGTDHEARMWEIDENLFRAEVTALERADLMKERVRLVGENVAQIGPPCGLQPREQGIRKTARDLDLSRSQIQRDLKVASITPEAKEAARAAGIADNQSKLLAVAAQPPEYQVGKVTELAKQRARRTPGQIAAAKREKAQRLAIKQQRQTEADERYATVESAVGNMVMLVLEHFPEESLKSFVKSLQAAGPSARITLIEERMRDQRPELFDEDQELNDAAAGDAHYPERPSDKSRDSRADQSRHADVSAESGKRAE